METNSASILYVEDNPGDILLIRTAFIEFGRHVTFQLAHDGETALRRLQELAIAPANRPDLILLDLNLPCLSGFEVLEHLRDNAQLELPVIVLTTSRDEHDRARCFELGCVDYFCKPTTVDGYRWLVPHIERLLAAS